jgi:L-fuconolactonase
VRIDAHQHFWRFDPVRDAWITPAMGALRRDFLPDDLAPLLAAASVDGVVAVQADQSIDETNFLLSLAAEHAFIKGVVGWIDLCSADITRQLDEWSGRSALKGFRHIAQSEADDFLTRDDVVRGINTVARHGYAYDILVYPRQLAAAQQLVARCPNVHFVLDHCAKPPVASGNISEWRAGFRALAVHENVTCKLSGLVTEATWASWSSALLVPYLDEALEAFGPQRLMVGSDWPVCLLAGDYGTVIGVVEEWAKPLTPDERKAIFGGTAVRAYQLEG